MMKKNSFTLFILFLSMLAASAANAEQSFPRDLPLSWDNPTTWDDDVTPLLDTDLAAIHVSCVRNADTVPVFTATLPALPPGAHHNELFAQVIPRPGTYVCIAQAITDQDIWSLPSNEALKKYTGRTRPPANLKFEVL